MNDDTTKPAGQPSLSETDLSIINDIYERAHAEHRSPVSMMKDLLLWYKNADKGWNDLQKILTPAGQPTEAKIEERHRVLVKQLRYWFGCGNWDDFTAGIIANFEARAVSEATKELREERENIMGAYRQQYDTIKSLRAQLAQAEAVDASTKELREQLELLESQHETRLAAFEEYKKLRDAQLAQAEAERDTLAKKLSDQSMSVIVDMDKFDEIQAKADRCERAEAALAQGQADSKRLDWLEAISPLTAIGRTPSGRCSIFSPDNYESAGHQSFRAAIDAAMSQQLGGAS
jgi:hypothetical protein